VLQQLTALEQQQLLCVCALRKIAMFSLVHLQLPQRVRVLYFLRELLNILKSRQLTKLLQSK